MSKHHRTYVDGRPRAYAREKLKKLRGWKHGEIGEITRRFAAIAFPEVPVDVLLGFTASAEGPEDNTTEKHKTQHFHEVGLYQVEAGLRGGPAPNPNPKAEHNCWGRLHDSALVRQMLGRPATMEPDGWRDSLEDQIAVGLAHLRRHGDRIQELLGADVPDERWSNWYFLCAFTAFSRGEGQALKVIRPYFHRICATPEDTRWTHLRRLVVEDCRARRLGIGSQQGGHGACYALVRTEQKYESAYLLASNTDGQTGWFASRYPETDQGELFEGVICRVAYNTALPPSMLLPMDPVPQPQAFIQPPQFLHHHHHHHH